MQNLVTIVEGESMAAFIAGTSKSFFVNGERFTLAGVRYALMIRVTRSTCPREMMMKSIEKHGD